MIRRPPRSTRTDTLFPYTTLFRSTLSRLSVRNGPGSRLRHWCSSQYLRISPLHWEFHYPLPLSSNAVSNAHPRLSPGLSRPTNVTASAPFPPSNSEQRSPTPYSRACWPGFSRVSFTNHLHHLPPPKCYTTLHTPPQ